MIIFCSVSDGWWSGRNHLLLNVNETRDETRDMVIVFRRKTTAILGKHVNMVRSYGIHVELEDQHSKWSVCKKSKLTSINVYSKWWRFSVTQDFRTCSAVYFSVVCRGLYTDNIIIIIFTIIIISNGVIKEFPENGINKVFGVYTSPMVNTIQLLNFKII